MRRQTKANCQSPINITATTPTKVRMSRTRLFAARSTASRTALISFKKREEKAPEAPKPTAHSIERLDSLSVDIARMIDHDAAGSMEEKKKEGYF